MELFYLYGTIAEIDSHVFANKNKILLMVDPFHSSYENFKFGLNVYNWKYDEENKIMSYKKLPYALSDLKVNGSFLHSNLLEKEELLYHISKTQTANLNNKNLNEILDEIKRSVDDDLQVRSNTNNNFNNVNLHNVKKQLSLTERFLLVIENYLNNSTQKTNDDILYKIDLVLNELVNYFDREEVLEFIRKEFRQNQIIDSLTNLLNVQVMITEKINKFNL